MIYFVANPTLSAETGSNFAFILTFDCEIINYSGTRKSEDNDLMVIW